MPRSQNDTHVPPEDRPSVAFSPADLVIPICICVVIGVLLFFAFQPERPAQAQRPLAAMNEITTASLEKRFRTAEIAKQLVHREDVSFETAKSCVTRLATLQNQNTSVICLQLIQDLPSNSSRKTKRRWAALLQEHVSTENLEAEIHKTGVQESFPPAPLAGDDTKNQLLWAALIANSPNRISAIFKTAARDTQHTRGLLQAIPIITDQKINQRCFAEIQKWILNPACQNPRAVNSQLILAAIQCVTEIRIDAEAKASAFCQLAIAGVCRTESFISLQALGVDSIPAELHGPIAATLLEHLADFNKNPQAIRCDATWSFAKCLPEVFEGRKRKRYEDRLAEIQIEEARIGMKP